MQSPATFLTPRQLKASQMLFSEDGGIIWWRVGTGKTRIGYNWFAMIARSIAIKNPIFIVVCRRKAFEDWRDEAVFKLKLNWIVCNYETYLWPRRTRPTVLLVSHGMLHKIVSDLMAQRIVLEAVIYDEGFLYKNAQSKHCKAARKLSEQVGRAGIMSGSVMTARNIEDIYGQTLAINRHPILAKHLTEFRTRYQFKLKISNFPIRLPAKHAKENILKKLSYCTSVYFPENTREVRNIEIEIEPTIRQLAYIKALKEEYYLKLKTGESLELKNKPSLIIKCQQISDGFLKMPSVSEGGVISFASGKYEWLLDKLQELLACGESVVVWCAFQQTVASLLQRLQKDLTKYANTIFTMVGGRSFDVAGWRNSGRIALATVDSGTSVNHFEQCAYGIYYSMSFRWLSLQQSQGRTDRKASRHSICFYYYLYTRGSLDKFVHRKALSSGTEEQQLIELQTWLTEKEYSKKSAEMGKEVSAFSGVRI